MLVYDPLYLGVMLVCIALAAAAQAWVTTAVRSQGKRLLRSGAAGADIAAAILAESGLRDVRIEEHGGFLTDHYDPQTRTLRLSVDTYEGRTVASAGIAAHEAGHALQHAGHYWPMQFRQRLVPLANVGTQLGVLLIVTGLALGTLGLAKIGVLVFAGFVLFTIVTLPVEIDASRRAREVLAHSGMLAPAELDGVARVLRAAAATYVAATLSAILQLVYFGARVMSGRRRRR